MIEFVYDDGGRADAGYRGTTGDCATRAVAIATRQPYQTVYDTLIEYGLRERPRGRSIRSHARTGVHNRTMRRYMDDLGWLWTPTMEIGSGCQVHLRADELPAGRLVLSLSKHYAAMIDRVLYDNHDSSRDGTRCVYGYWTMPHGWLWTRLCELAQCSPDFDVVHGLAEPEAITWLLARLADRGHADHSTEDIRSAYHSWSTR